VVGLVKPVSGIVVPLHTVMLAGTVTRGVGLTVIMHVNGGPWQLFKVGVTVIDTLTGLVPVLTAVNDGILPVPPAPRPMAVFGFVQVYVLPAGTLTKLVAGTTSLLQT